MQVQLEFDAAGRRCPDLAGAGLQDPLLGHRARARHGGFSVSYTLNKFQPATVPVQVIRNPGDLTDPATATTDPNPVVAELQPAGPPPKPSRKPMRPKKPKTAQGCRARRRLAVPRSGRRPAAGVTPHRSR